MPSTPVPTASDEIVRIPLTRTLHLWQRKQGHRTGTDDVLCAWAGVSARPDARHVLDLGAGHGSVTLMMAGALSATANILAVEVQKISFGLLERNIADNDLGERVRGMLADLRSVELAPDSYELVTGVPPFMPLGTGTLPRDPQRAAARFEMHGGIEDYCQLAARVLAPSGLLSLVMDAARPARYREAIAAAGLGLTRTVEVRPRPGAPPTYLIYQATPGSGAESTASEILCIRDAGGQLSAEYRAIRRALDLPNP